MTEEAKAAKKAYHKEWRARNKDKIKEYNRRYWEKQAAKMQKVKV